jgi:hypothetical protein
MKDKSSTPDLTLELSADEMHPVGYTAMERIVPHVASLPQQPSVDVEGATEMARTLERAAARARPTGRTLSCSFSA